MRFNVKDRIVFLTKHKYETHQVMAEVTNTFEGDRRKNKSAYVRAKVLGTDQPVTFDPQVPESMVRIIPKELDSIDECLMWLAEQGVSMGEEDAVRESSPVG